MEGFLDEVEMTDYGYRESRAWWESVFLFPQMFLEENIDNEEQNAVVECGFHGYV